MIHNAWELMTTPPETWPGTDNAEHVADSMLAAQMHDELSDILASWGLSRTVQALSDLFDERRRELGTAGDDVAALTVFEAARVFEYQAERLRKASL